MSLLGGIKIIESKAVPEGKLVVLGNPPPIEPPRQPDESDEAWDDRVLKWLVAHGAILVVQNIETFKQRIDGLSK